MYTELGTMFIESQGAFAPERLATDYVYSRRFYRQEEDGTYTIVTIYAAAVYSESSERYYPEVITQTDSGETDYNDIQGDDCDYEYDSYISYVDYDEAIDACNDARLYIQTLNPAYALS